ncbi:zeta toxin family protein [Terasakiella brassicae]|uniref:zeta toxin family protein n=1 Tax=Terasakiella brassicae TaxID=1634917 RepID=UPI00357139B6
MKSRTSFIVETTFSGRAGFNLIRKARGAGFQIKLIYMKLNSWQQSLGRVYSRVLDGGHRVPPEDIKRRFERVDQNIRQIMPQLDAVHVFENAGLKPVRDSQVPLPSLSSD